MSKEVVPSTLFKFSKKGLSIPIQASLSGCLVSFGSLKKMDGGLLRLVRCVSRTRLARHFIRAQRRAVHLVELDLTPLAGIRI